MTSEWSVEVLETADAIPSPAVRLFRSTSVHSAVPRFA
jgi:hypothetical protein